MFEAPDRATGGGEERLYRQQRLALFAGVLFIIDACGTVLQAAGNLPEALSQPSTLLLLGMTALVGVFVPLLRRPSSLSERALDLAELALLLTASVATGLVAHAVPAENVDALFATEPPDDEGRFFAEVGVVGFVWALQVSCTLALTQTFALRAAIVPSSGRRTLGLTVLGGVVMAAIFALPVPGWEADARIRAEVPFFGLPMLVSVFIWWTLTTIVCVATSKVVHGLRREVRDAKRLGQYRLEERIGEGGMGVVYRAKHALLRRPTAVKLVLPEKAGPKALARFEREVRLTATLTHPHTVTVYDYGRTPEGVFYYAMELLEGASLEAIVRATGAMPPSRALHILRRVAAALSEAHGLGLIHRDVKPSNIMLSRRGGVPDVPKLLDFGLVKELEQDEGQLTEESTLTGTPLYLAPECILEPSAASPASDLYALGAVAFFLLTGTHVFKGRNVVEICGHHLHSAPDRPSARLGRALPQGLDELVLSCLEKEPEARPVSARAFVAALREVQGVEPWTEDDAETWWASHPDLIATKTATTPSEDTMQVELGDR